MMTRQLGVRVPTETAEKLDDFCDRYRVAPSEVVRAAINRMLEEHPAGWLWKPKSKDGKRRSKA